MVKQKAHKIIGTSCKMMLLAAGHNWMDGVFELVAYWWGIGSL